MVQTFLLFDTITNEKSVKFMENNNNILVQYHGLSGLT